MPVAWSPPESPVATKGLPWNCGQKKVFAMQSSFPSSLSCVSVPRADCRETLFESPMIARAFCSSLLSSLSVAFEELAFLGPGFPRTAVRRGKPCSTMRFTTVYPMILLERSASGSRARSSTSKSRSGSRSRNLRPFPTVRYSTKSVPKFALLLAQSCMNLPTGRKASRRDHRWLFSSLSGF